MGYNPQESLENTINTMGTLLAHSAKGPWNKSLNFIFPTKYVIPKVYSG